MKGKILGFDGRTGEGVISGEDGQRYPFDTTDWQQRNLPQAGQTVDFAPAEGKALSVYGMTAVSPMSGEKNKIVAALLAFFLGGLGIHKFYLGKTTAGIIMLLVSLFGFILLFIPTLVIGIIAFIEFIIYLATSDEEFHRKYVEGNASWF